ncbi:MAG: hypothetical protein B7Y02_11260 [Rhodobacterales bacterium 17-64-5]|nr:MAG: hypothetical protein B7Y02_11260 [Rhodobacterales bacterium 17-64-5]
MTARRFIFELAGSGAGGAAAPEWVHLLPAGASTLRDGRKCILANAEAVIAQFHADAVDLPIDYEHQADRPEARNNGPVPAAGWIKELAARPDGLWGRVEWTATAARMIAAKEYRYLSPSFLIEKASTEVQKLCGAGLVHHPALELTALASQETAMKPTSKLANKPAMAADDAQDEATEADLAKAITDLFGLAPDMPLAQLVAALKAIAAKLNAPPDPAQFMPVTAVQAMMAERSAELATATEGRAQLKVDAAFRQGYIHGGMRDWALALCRSDEAAFDGFLAKAGPTFGGLTRNHGAALSGTPPSARAATRSEAADAICTQLGLPMGSLTK